VERRRTSVGGDREPRTQVDPSCLDLDPMNVTACLFELAGLPISPVCRGPDDIPRDRYLSEITEILHAWIRPLKPYSPISGSPKQRVKSLSLNQLFLSVFQSHRRDSLIQAKSETSKHLQLSSLLFIWKHRRKVQAGL
jgi:hypothetical protein